MRKTGLLFCLAQLPHFGLPPLLGRQLLQRDVVVDRDLRDSRSMRVLGKETPF